MTGASRTSQFEPYSGADCTITSLVGASFMSASSSQGSIGSDGLSRLATKKIPTITIRITSRIIACLNIFALGSSLLVTNGCLLKCLISEQIFFFLGALRTRTCRSADLILALNCGDFKELQFAYQLLLVLFLPKHHSTRHRHRFIGDGYFALLPESGHSL